MLTQVVYLAYTTNLLVVFLYTPLCKSPIFTFDSGQNIARSSRIMALHLRSAQGGILCEISLLPRNAALLHFRPQAGKNGAFTWRLVYILYESWLLGVFLVYALQTSSGLGSRVVYTPHNHDLYIIHTLNMHTLILISCACISDSKVSTCVNAASAVDAFWLKGQGWTLGVKCQGC